MNDTDAAIRTLYDLQRQLLESQGWMIAALQETNEALLRSHAVIADRLIARNGKKRPYTVIGDRLVVKGKKR